MQPPIPKSFTPINVIQVELSQPIPTINSQANSGYYQRARLLVKMYDIPIGMLDVEWSGEGLEAAALTTMIWEALQLEINEQLDQEGLEPIIILEPSGISHAAVPRSRQMRQDILRAAPLISVAIATHERADFLKATIDSILSSNYPNFEIIIIDNGEVSGATEKLFEEHYRHFSNVRYCYESLASTGNARNRGVKEAKGTIVALPDDDILVDPNWLANLALTYELYEDAGCVTGLVIPAELETESQLWYEEFTGSIKGFKRRIFDLQENRPKRPFYFPYVPGILGKGANMSFRTTAIRDVGGFSIYMGGGTPTLAGDDNDVFFQVLVKGYKVIYEPTALIAHFNRREYDQLHRQLYGHVVGNYAALTKWLLEKPSRILDILFKVPYIPYALYIKPDIERKSKHAQIMTYPSELNTLRRKGLLDAPWRYLKSRWKLRHFA